MKNSHRWTSLTLALLIFVAALAPAGAQFDPGEYNIIQGGVLVGGIFVPPRDDETCVYWENWFVFDTYQYPGSQEGLETIIEVAEEAEQETLRRIREGEGHWIRVESFEQREECLR